MNAYELLLEWREKLNGLEGAEYLQALRNHIIHGRKISGFDSSRPYVPDHIVWVIRSLQIPWSGIISGLLLNEVEEKGSFEEFASRATKIFIILVIARLEAKMKSFFEHKFSDMELPFELDEEGVRSFQGRLSDTQKSIFSSGWSSSEIHEFHDHQWQVVVPYLVFDPWFAGSTIPKQYPPQTILPLNVLGRPKATGFSRVWHIEVELPRGHFLPQSYSPQMYKKRECALKECAVDVENFMGHISNSEQYQHELGILNLIIRLKRAKTLRRSPTYLLSRHHLIWLQGAFQRGNMSYLVFPWVSDGNLYEYCQNHERPNFENPREWIIKQFEGLLGALTFLHALGCRHGDLKPGNILVHRKNESEASVDFMIADFGISRIHEQETRARNHATQAGLGSYRYQPPEVDSFLTNPGPLSRRYDVWSMGCIFMELIIWFRYGKAGLNKFNEELGDRHVASFWTKTDEGRLGVHSAVYNCILAMMNELANEQDSFSGYLLYVLEKIKYRMLVLEAGNHTTDDQEYRATSQALFNNFRDDNRFHGLCKNIKDLETEVSELQRLSSLLH